MNSMTLKSAVLALGLVALAACSSTASKTDGKTDSTGTTTAEKTTTTPPAAVVDVAAKENASSVAEISFAKDSAVLTEEARQALVNTLNTAKTVGAISDVKVIAWADKEYPTANEKKLTKKDRTLADNRAKAVKTFVKSVSDVKKVDTYNMAKRPTAVAKLFKTDDAQLKKTLETAGLVDSAALDRAHLAKASNTIVMVITK